MLLSAVLAAAALTFVIPQVAPQPAVDASLVTALTEATSDAARRELLDRHASSLTAELQRALADKGVELRRAGRMPAAASAFLSARDIAERLGDRARMAMALVSYSSVPGSLGDYPAAMAALDQAIAIGEALGDDAVIGAALTNVAIIYSSTGDYERSLATSRRSLAIAVAAKDEAWQGRLYNGIGVSYARQGHFRAALDAYDKAIALQPASAALTLTNIGNVYSSQGNLELSLDYYSKALALIVESGGGESPDALTQHTNLGIVMLELGRLDAALESFERGQALSEKLKSRNGQASTAYNIASVRKRQGRKDEALAGFRRALALREAMNDRTGIRVCLHAIGELLAELGRHAEALAAEEQAVAIAREMKSTEMLWEPLKVIASVRHAMREPAAAEAAYREAIATIETIRTQVGGGFQARRQFFEDKLPTYHGLTTLLIEQNRTEEALRAAEHARGRVLAELLAGPDVATASLTPDERVRQQDLEREVVSLTGAASAAERRQPRDEAAVTAAAARLSTARRAADEYRDTLDARYPRRRLERGEELVDPLIAVRELLVDPQTAILEYVVTDAATYLFVVTRSAQGVPAIATFQVKTPRDALKARIDAFRGKLAARALDFQVDARALYDTLLRPARPALAGVTRLIVIPDDVLWTIPFDALAPAAGRALIDDVTVAYAPSIAVLRAMHERRVALAAHGLDPTVVVAADPTSDLPKLPDTARQAADLRTLYGPARTQLFVGDEATEPRVRAAAADAWVLHFATHGVVDDTNPMYSFLQLTRTGPAEAATDGRLEAWEILSMRLDASVAVLTACDTARGTIGGGEGVISLAWAFFAAGTPATVVSLWQLESRSATALTLALHRRLRESILKQRGGVAESLRAAALELRRDARYRHPFYWAGLVAVGDAY